MPWLRTVPIVSPYSRISFYLPPFLDIAFEIPIKPPRAHQHLSRAIMWICLQSTHHSPSEIPVPLFIVASSSLNSPMTLTTSHSLLVSWESTYYFTWKASFPTDWESRMTSLTSMAGRRATKHCYGVSHCFCLLYIEFNGGCRRGGLFFFFSFTFFSLNCT